MRVLNQKNFLFLPSERLLSSEPHLLSGSSGTFFYNVERTEKCIMLLFSFTLPSSPAGRPRISPRLWP
jgi:hypothetical protein